MNKLKVLIATIAFFGCAALAQATDAPAPRKEPKAQVVQIQVICKCLCCNPQMRPNGPKFGKGPRDGKGPRGMGPQGKGPRGPMPPAK
jgi:hypothetical protein